MREIAIASLIAGALGAYAGFEYEHAKRVAEVAQIRADAAEAVLERQREIQRANSETSNRLQADKDRVSRDLRSALDRLRDYRPDMPACANASAGGSDAGPAIELPRANAEAALALAAEADAVVSQLKACQKTIRDLTGG